MPALHEMFRRLLIADRQSRAARSVEWFGWLDLALGIVMFSAPYFTASVLRLPALDTQGADYLRLAGLLVSGLGMLYVVGGRLNSTEFAFASMLDRPLVPAIMAVLWYRRFLPGPLALAFSASDFGGFVWTGAAWYADVTRGPRVEDRPTILVRAVAGLFGFASGVLRNARTFHPDGRTFRGTIRPLRPADAGLAHAAERLEGAVFLRIGMGLMKRGMPRWIATRLPDAPSIATRVFTASTPGEIRLDRRPDEDLDLLCTAGGDRLWKLVLNIATGGRMYGLKQFDYFANVYSADVPYKIDEMGLDVWLRLVPDVDRRPIISSHALEDNVSREKGLSDAVARRATFKLEAQHVGDRRAPFVPIAEVRLETEIDIDQEAVHFEPVAGRGFAPHGFLTDLRKHAYPASVQSRPPSRMERVQRDDENVFTRLKRFFGR
jgi:hypothetical protein